VLLRRRRSPLCLPFPLCSSGKSGPALGQDVVLCGGQRRRGRGLMLVHVIGRDAARMSACGNQDAKRTNIEIDKVLWEGELCVCQYVYRCHVRRRTSTTSLHRPRGQSSGKSFSFWGQGHGGVVHRRRTCAVSVSRHHCRQCRRVGEGQGHWAD
jgi:hypothetical protein